MIYDFLIINTLPYKILTFKIDTTLIFLRERRIFMEANFLVYIIFAIIIITIVIVVIFSLIKPVL